MGLRLLRHELGQNTSESQCVLAERRPHPVVTGRRRVALVEDQINDFQDRGESCGELCSPGNLERYVFLGERPLGPHDPLGDRRLGGQKRPGDLFGRQATNQSERERQARLGREHRVTGGEHEPQEIVADVIIERRVEIRRLASGLDLVTELLVLALEELVAAEHVDRAMLGGRHQPGTRIARHA